MKFSNGSKQKSQFIVIKPTPTALEVKRPKSQLPLPVTRPTSTSTPKPEIVKKDVWSVSSACTAVKKIAKTKVTSLHEFLSPSRKKTVSKVDQQVLAANESLICNNSEKMESELDTNTKMVIYKTLYHMTIKAWRKRKEMVMLQVVELNNLKKSVRILAHLAWSSNLTYVHTFRTKNSRTKSKLWTPCTL